jgi:hypothetical protein
VRLRSGLNEAEIEERGFPSVILKWSPMLKSKKSKVKFCSFSLWYEILFWFD